MVLAPVLPEAAGGRLHSGKLHPHGWKPIGHRNAGRNPL